MSWRVASHLRLRRIGVEARSCLGFAVLLGALGCDPPPSGGRTSRPEISHPEAIVLVDVATERGLDFVHENGARGERALPETTVGGAAWLDHDGDGRLDLYLANAAAVDARGEPVRNRLFRQRADGRFEDCTVAAGVGDTGFAQGVAVGDYDRDGRVDLYVANFGANVLYRNLGEGRFEDVTEAAGVGDDSWSTTAAFVDLDADGDLDLYVSNYVVYDPERVCRTRDIITYCSPHEFPGAPDRLYRNIGEGRFEDISVAAGVAIAGPSAGKSLGVVPLDYDDDGDTDLYVACDQVRNVLLRNDGRGVFEDVALIAGVAFSEEGLSQAGMGVDAGDADLDGRLDLVVTNFSDERNAFYRNLGGGTFDEISRANGVGAASISRLGFGVLLFDVDLDGDLDLYTGNGHVLDNASEVREGQTFEQADQLLVNDGRGSFRDVSDELAATSAGSWFARRTVTRSVASADFDEDGDEDLVVLSSGAPVALLANESRRGRWIAWRLRGTRSNPDGYGARVEVRSLENGVERVRRFECRSARSYGSACDPRIRVGLGSGEVRVVEARITWSTGVTQTIADPELDRVHEVVEAP